ncbi:hypothetical protein BH11ACT8_BH11ACT8_11760 [soil metagenome]
MTSNPVRVLALIVTLASVGVTAALLFVVDGDGVGLMRMLDNRGDTAVAAGVGWIVVAPLLFVLASSYVQVSTWPWVLLAVVDLGVLGAVSYRLREMMSVGYWSFAAICVVASLASIAMAAAGRGPTRGDF